MDIKKEVDRTIENELLAFTSKLAPNTNPEDIVALYKDLEKQHWIIESKIMAMRTIFSSVLSTEFAKEEESAMSGPEHPQSMFG